MKHLEDKNSGTVTLRRLDELDPPDQAQKSTDKLGIILDIETSGLDPENGDIIEISILPFTYDPETYAVTGYKSPITRLNEPKEPLSEIIKQITNLTDDDVQDHHIDWKRVADLLERADVVIAHNARFDWKWINASMHRAGIKMPQVPFCCSMIHANWQSIRLTSRSQELLCLWHGFYYYSHRAEADTKALLHLLRVSGRLGEIIKIGTSDEYRIFAAGFPINENHRLKSRYYQFDREARAWFKSCNTLEEANAEKEFISNFKGTQPHIYQIPSTQRWS